MFAARRLLAMVVVAAFAVVVGLALLVPLYSDEITSWFQLTRALKDGGGQGSLLFPLCHGVFTRPLPVTAIPGAVFYRVILGGLGPFGLRVSSLVIVGAWFVAIWRVTRGRELATFCAIHAFGTFPLALVTARVEPVMLVALGTLAWLAIRKRRARVAGVLLFVVATSILYASHQRALLYTPFMLVAAFAAFGWRRRGWIATTLVAGFVVAAAVQAYGAARATADCPNSPTTEARLRDVSLTPQQAIRSPGLVVRNIANFVDVDTTMMMLEPHPPEFHWIPEDDATWLPKGAAPIADRLTRIGIIALLVVLPLAIVFALVRARNRPSLRRRALLAAALLFGVTGSVAVTKIVAFYNLAGVLPLLALAALLVAPAFTATSRAVAATLAVVLQVAALASLAAVFLAVMPKLVALEARPTTIYPDRPATIPIANAARERGKIRATAQACGIDGDHASRLVVDDATLFAFDDLREPIHLIYVTDAAMWGDDYPGRKNVTLLDQLGASGLITRCTFLPTVLASKVRHEGDYCCASAADIRSL